MRKILMLTAAFAIAAFAISPASIPQAHAQQVLASAKPTTIKTRLDHFVDTDFVLVVSYIPSEITSITCEKWTMLGIKSWGDQNNFTIPSGPAIAVINAHGFDGYCTEKGSIVAHTDDGDFVAFLDRGGWKDSTKLTIPYAR